MKYYKRKLEVIEAEQWNKLGDVAEVGITKYVGDHTKGWLKSRNDCTKSYIISPGDYIVLKKDRSGYYAIDKEIFESLYVLD